jgi:hypothetical protein
MWPEDEGTVIFQNVTNELPTNTAYLLRRLEFSDYYLFACWQNLCQTPDIKYLRLVVLRGPVECECFMLPSKEGSRMAF